VKKSSARPPSAIEPFVEYQAMSDLMRTVKEQKWFYEFRLPDGSTTDSYLPPHVRAIHLTRGARAPPVLALRDWSSSTALDVACHEGFYSLVLNDYFGSVTGLDKNAGSLNKARQSQSCSATRRSGF